MKYIVVICKVLVFFCKVLVFCKEMLVFCKVLVFCKEMLVSSEVRHSASTSSTRVTRRPCCRGRQHSLSPWTPWRRSS